MQLSEIRTLNIAINESSTTRNCRCGSRRLGEDEPSLHQQLNEVCQPIPSSVDVAISHSSHKPEISSFDPSRYSMAPWMDYMRNLIEYQLHVLMERRESS